MIIARHKALAEILEMVAPYRRLLVATCEDPRSACPVHGREAADALLAQLRQGGFAGEMTEILLARPCDGRLPREIQAKFESCDAILLLGCSLGTQALAETQAGKPVFPGQDMLIKGGDELPRPWGERCVGCGDCLLGRFAGICPLTRCDRGLANGPCGAAEGDGCETDPRRIPCAWQLIVRRLEAQGRMGEVHEIIPPRDWFTAHAGGPKPLIWEETEFE
jgi:hypothetical protein